MESLRELLTTLSYWGPVGGFVAGFLDAAFLPLIQIIDVIVVARAAAGGSDAWTFAAATWAGSVSGSLALFRLAYQGRRVPGLREISKDRTAKLLKRMERYPALVLFAVVTIPLPLPVKAFLVTAGVLKLSFRRVAVAVAAGRGIRYFGLAWLGGRYGEGILYLFQQYRWPLLGIVAVALLVLTWRLTAARARAQASRGDG